MNRTRFGVSLPIMIFKLQLVIPIMKTLTKKMKNAFKLMLSFNVYLDFGDND